MAISPKEINMFNNQELIKQYEEKFDTFLKENYNGKEAKYYFKSTNNNFNINLIKYIYEKVGWKVEHNISRTNEDAWLIFSEK